MRGKLQEAIDFAANIDSHCQSVLIVGVKTEEEKDEKIKKIMILSHRIYKLLDDIKRGKGKDN